MDTEVSVKTKGEERPIRTTRRNKRGKERTPWQRIALSLIGIVIILAQWRWATYHLYALPEHSITAFTSISNNAAYVIGALVVFFVTGRLVYEWKNQTVSDVVEHTEHVFEKRDEKNQSEHTEHIIDEGAPGSPSRRPWKQAQDE